MNSTVLTKDYLNQIILSDNNDIRLKFQENFAKEINQFIDDLFVVHEDYKILDKYSREDWQKVWVAGYTYKAIQDVMNAFTLFIHGFILPSGNSMRQFHESTAMAIMLSNKKLKNSEEFIKDPPTFRVSTVFKKIENNLSSFELNQVGWKAFCDNKDFYHQFSHSSAFSVSSLANFETRQNFVGFGPFYDKGKEKQYLQEINQMIKALGIFRNIISGIKVQLGILELEEHRTL